jgi:adenosylmethionine-8-amino-7-oxononanoate aminotransferase
MSVAREALRRGLYINVGSSDTGSGSWGDNIGLAPPLVVSAEEIDHITDLLAAAIAAAERKLSAGEGGAASHG